MQPDLEQRSAAVSLAGQTLTGYALLFDVPSLDLGGFVEVIEPRAVDRTFSERLDVRALVDHDRSKVIGRTTAGTLTLTKDARGLKVDIMPPETTAGRDILESVRRGDVSGMSFTFAVVRPGGERFEQRSGQTIRTLSDFRINEVSIVTFPAYEGTSVDVSVAQRSLAAFQAGRQRGTTQREQLQRRHAVRVAR